MKEWFIEEPKDNGKYIRIVLQDGWQEILREKKLQKELTIQVKRRN
ncbi:MAG: hypothetical protein IIZ39_02650 [Blautia sp.]|nr:hypothetical protein [Blautia sp.]